MELKMVVIHAIWIRIVITIPQQPVAIAMIINMIQILILTLSAKVFNKLYFGDTLGCGGREKSYYLTNYYYFFLIECDSLCK